MRVSILSWVAAVAVLGCTPVSARPLLSAHVPAGVREHAVAVTGAPNQNARLQLTVALPMRHQGELNALLEALYNPQSPLFHRWLSVAEFTKRFGPTERDYDTAVRFFGASGLRVTGTTPNRYLIPLEGKVADIERVFHIRLKTYHHPTEDRAFLAPDREPSLDLAVPVLRVSGLDDFVQPYSKLAGQRSDIGRKRTGSGPDGNFIGSDFRAAYYGKGKNATLTGAGQSVGLVEFLGYMPADVTLYFNTVGEQINVPINGISVDGTAVDCGSCNDGEQVLDIEYAVSMAPGLAQVQFYVSRDPLAMLNRIATDNTSKQISDSWGWGRDLPGEDPIYQEMAAQGQTFLVASGDYSSLKRSGQWPEEDANVVGVGGTDLVTKGPAGPYLLEKGWKDSGGGPSLDKHIPIEPYQLPYINRRNGGSTILRNVPDVSANANYDMFICFKNKCNGGWGGTSFAAPEWAGFVALINEQGAKNGKQPVGFLNPTLYGMLKDNKTVLHDPVGNHSGLYNAVRGYDLVTGLGSPTGRKLIRALAGN